MCVCVLLMVGCDGAWCLFAVMAVASHVFVADSSWRYSTAGHSSCCYLFQKSVLSFIPPAPLLTLSSSLLLVTSFSTDEMVGLESGLMKRSVFRQENHTGRF